MAPQSGGKPRQVELRDGGRVWVRPVAHTDQGELKRAFAQLSDLSRYRRFMTGTPELSDQMAHYFSHVDHVDHEALVALPSRRSRTIVGVARYIRHRNQPTDAELAVTIADPWHDRGLGTALVALLSDLARAAGVDRFTMDLLADNAAVRALVTSAGGGLSLEDGLVASGRIELRPVLVPLGNPVPELRPALRAVFALDSGR